MTAPASPDDVSQSFEGLSRYLGAQVTLRSDSSTEIVIPAAEHILDSNGRPSELAITCAIDIATGMASSMAGDTPQATLTSDLSIDLLAEPAPGALRTVGRVVKLGRRIIISEAVVTDSTGSAVAFATAGCSPFGEFSAKGQIGQLRPGDSVDLAEPDLVRLPIGQQYNTAPADLGADAPAPVASIALDEMTANPFGFLHGAVGAHLLMAGARRAGLAQVSSITVRYLRPTTAGPADVLVDDSFRSARTAGLKLSLRDRATAKIACLAHASGPTGDR